MKIVIAAAMKEELAPFREGTERETIIHRGRIIIEKVKKSKGQAIHFVETGIGKANAAASASLLCEKLRPNLVINTGSAGSFSESVAIGDVVCATALTYGDVDATGFDYELGQVPQMPARYSLPSKIEKIVAVLSEKQSEKYRLHKGLVVTADSFMSEEPTIDRIKRQFPAALASDMESTALAQICQFYDIPVLNIRGISDLVGTEAPTSFDNHLHDAAVHASEQVKKIIQLMSIMEEK